MTENYRRTSKKRFDSIIELALPLVGTLMMLLFLTGAGVASEGIVTALGVCIRSVIPSVFPCMVLSKFIIAMGGERLFSIACGRFTERIFELSRSAATPVVIGAFCGFPLGAVMAAELYLNGEMTRDEFERIIGFVSLPSPAFVINAVGGSMLGNRRVGVLLYLILLAVSFFIGSVICRMGRKSNISCSLALSKKKDVSISDAAVDAIGSSAVACLKLCAYIAFFTSMTAVIVRMFEPSEIFSALIGGFFEFSSGCLASVRLESGASLPLCGLILGWSGIGVHFQIMSVCPKGTSYKYFYITIALRSVICFLLMLIVNLIWFDI